MRWRRQKEDDHDLQRELQSDLELEAEEQREAGLSAEEARYAAQRKLGHAMRIREEIYRMDHSELLDTLSRDLRHSLRLFRKSPGATMLSVLSITLGIGLTTGMFSVGDAMLLRPMPFHRPAELLRATSRGDDGQPFLYGFPDYLDMAAAGRDLAELAAYQQRGSTLAAGDETEHVLADSVTPNYFSLLGVRALLGQASVGIAAGRPQVVLGYRLWQRRFGGDANVVGRSVLLRGKAFVVAGVMSEEFTGIERGMATDVWMSNDAWFHVIGGRNDEVNRGGQFQILARLKPRVTAHHAAAVLDSAIRGPGKHKPAPAGATGTVLEQKFAPNWAASVIFGGGLLLALSLVLFVACANVAQLRLAQAESRRKELGVRLALGAGTWRLAGQLFVESVVLSLAGAGLGILLARFLMSKASEFLAAGRVSVDYAIRLDYRVLAFTLLALVLSVLYSGLAPARHALKLNIAEVFKSEQGAIAPRGGRHQKLLVIGQIAVSVALFGTAAMFLVSLNHALAVRPGLDPQKQLLVMTVGPGWNIEPATWCDQVCERIATVAGVRGATYARRLPLSSSGWGWTARVEIPGQAPLGVAENDVGGNYFTVMGTRVLAGRGIDTNDRPGTSRVAVVSEAFARQVFPGRNPVGEWVKISGAMRQVVGIAEDGPSKDLHEAPPPFVYLPYGQAPDSGDITLMVETAREPLALARAVRSELKSYDPHAEVYSTLTLKRQMDEALSQDRTMASATGMLGIFGVVLTGAGLFGVLLYAVSRRTRELGLRLALGARPAQIQRMILAESLGIAAEGIPVGLMLLAGAGWYLRSWLLGISPADPVVYAASAGAVLALTLLAAWTPAVRATHVDPMTALRGQ
jgi:predicted permease